MSTTANPFELQIRFLHVPDALVGIPLPAEVVSATGSVQPVVLTVAEDQPVTTQVSAPGRYLVRAELPSGRWVAQAADVPENPATPKPPSATATLDLEVPALPLSPRRPRSHTVAGSKVPGRRSATSSVSCYMPVRNSPGCGWNSAGSRNGEKPPLKVSTWFCGRTRRPCGRLTCRAASPCTPTRAGYRAG